MEPLRELFIKLGLDWNGSQFALAQLSVDGLEFAARKLVDVFSAVGRAATESVTKTAAYGDHLDEAKVKTSTNTTALQEFTYAMSLSGVGAEQLETGLTFLSSKMAEALKGSEEAQAGFTKLGVKLRDGNGNVRSTDDLFQEIGDKLKEMPDDFRRVALARELLGKSGAAFLPAFVAGLQEARDEAHDLGVVMDEEAIARSAEFQDNVDKLHAAWSSFSRDVGSVLIEVLGPLVAELVGWVKVNRELIRTRLQTFARALGSALQFAAKTVERLSAALELFIGALKILGVATLAYVVATQLMNVGLLQTLVNFALNTAAAILYGYTLVASAVRAAAAWLAVNAPVLLLAAAFTLAALAAEDVYVFLKGGDSVIGSLGVKWTNFLNGFLAISEDDPWWLKALKAGLQVLTDLHGAWAAFEKEFPMLSAVLTGSVHTTGLTKDEAGIWRGSMRLERDADKTDADAEAFQRAKTMRAIYGDNYTGGSFAMNSKAFGGGGGPAATVAASPTAAANSSRVFAPRVNAPISVTAQPGQSAQDVAGEVRKQMDDFWDSKMREGAESVPGWEGG